MQRYERQLILPEIGEAGQARLAASAVGIVGVGGLGSPVAQYLAAAGVGRLVLVDDDVVEEVNLNRQVIHRMATVGAPKTESAAAALRALNPAVAVETRTGRLTAATGPAMLRGVDLIVDCCDSHATRYDISATAVALGVPVVHGSVIRWEGVVTVLHHRGGPCYRCLFPVPPDPALFATAKTDCVVGPICGVVGSLQAMEAVKVLLGCGGLSGAGPRWAAD